MRVREMFARIAPRYDLMNRLMSGGRDTLWRAEAVRRLELAPGDRLLDLGAGTGDLAVEALRQEPGCYPVAADLTLPMMAVGHARSPQVVRWACADALRLPFPDRSFDALVSGFLLRNVSDLQAALVEQYRVLKPGGRLVTLDTTRPRPSLLSPLARLYLRGVIPLLGWLVTGHRDAYAYLPASTFGFVRAEELAVRLAAAGFRKVAYRVRMYGTVAIHWGVK